MGQTISLSPSHSQPRLTHRYTHTQNLADMHTVLVRRLSFQWKLGHHEGCFTVVFASTPQLPATINSLHGSGGGISDTTLTSLYIFTQAQPVLQIQIRWPGPLSLLPAPPILILS